VCKEQRVIALAGYICAGKSTLAEAYCARHSGARTLLISDLLRERMEDLGLSTERKHMSAFYGHMAAEHGETFLVDLMLEHMRANPAEVYVLDGWRRIAQAERMSAHSDIDLKVVFLRAQSDLRFDRWVERGRPEDGPDFSREAFDAQNNLETEREIPDLLGFSDVVLDGNLPADVVLSRFEENFNNGPS
jgi:deoxyadenosine/deoxycytidine kinase